MMTRSLIVVVRFDFVGFHRWPDAAGVREYLASRHRHVFKVEAGIEVTQDDREIEFHDLLDYCKSHFPSGDYNDMSCEKMGIYLVESLIRRYGSQRRIEVAIFEDGENGARVIFAPDTSDH